MAKEISDLTDLEWNRLVLDFADKVLKPHNVAGSIAGVYSLYNALDDERAKARHLDHLQQSENKRIARIVSGKAPDPGDIPS